MEDGTPLLAGPGIGQLQLAKLAGAEILRDNVVFELFAAGLECDAKVGNSRKNSG